MAEILLTADKTLMSDYHSNEFLGFGTCAPPNFIPDWLFSYLFFPSLKTDKFGAPQTAPYGLRKTEAQLLKEGFKVATVSPQHLKENLKDAKVLGIHVMDPFGLGPASSTLAALFKKKPFLAKYFEQLMLDPEIKKAKSNGLKVIVGGPGAWQFHYREKALKDFGIDCIVEGEAEKVISKLVRTALNGEDLPSYYEVGVGEIPKLDEIPDIVKPSVNGLIEIGRGCCRGCQFCNVTLRPLRWYPMEKIERELDVNLKSGRVKGACIHAEDVMLYGSNSTTPNPEKLLELHKKIVSRCESISWSHCSLAAVASNPKLFHDLSEIILQKQSWWGVEIGIETGSSEVAKKIMPTKAHPFKADEWHDVVVEGMGLMHDHNLVPAGTLIVGLPDETEDDIIRTQELMDDLKGMRSLIVPLFFVPLGRLTDEDWFKDTKMNKQHRELMIQCAEHDFKWVDNLIDWTFKGKWYNKLMREFYRGFASIARYKVKQIE
ncbi:MAG: B12-binding domain-containing radical SAM protein [Candidatus Bathyarchaeota archaeon]|nr:B12-binding domain-containing radical SAM protein [Candidatus Termiticorpusculum sp.]